MVYRTSSIRLIADLVSSSVNYRRNESGEEKELRMQLTVWSRKTVSPSFRVSWNQSLHVTLFPVLLNNQSSWRLVSYSNSLQYLHTSCENTRVLRVCRISCGGRIYRNSLLILTNNTKDPLQVRVGAHVRPSLDICCVEYIQALVLHRTHVELLDEARYHLI